MTAQSVVGGANLMFGPDMSILLGAAKILFSDGKSKMWDADANGFARGEGFGVTILKVPTRATGYCSAIMNVADRRQ